MSAEYEVGPQVSGVSAEALSYEFSPDLVTLIGDRPYEAEAVRTIRTHIIARHVKDGRRGLSVCAATGNVGCSFTAANLAVSMARGHLDVAGRWELTRTAN